MTRVEIAKSKKYKRKEFWKEFNKNFIKQYFKFLGYVGIAIIGLILWMSFLIGAVNQHSNKVDAIRQGVVFDD